MATWSEYINVDERIPKHTIGDKVKWKSGSEKDFGKIIEGTIESHEWSPTHKKGKKDYCSSYEVIGNDGFKYYLIDSSFIK